MKQLLSWISAIMTFSCCCGIVCASSPAVESTDSINCSKEELMSFFPQPVVQAVLLQAKFSNEEAAAISKELSQKNPDLVKMIDEKASKMDPNPFKDLSQRDQGLKIYRETLYEVFSKVLKVHGIADEDQAHALLEEIRASKSKHFIECIRKQQTSSFPSPSQTAPQSS